MIVVDRSRTQWTGTAAEWRNLQAELKARTCVHLPAFLDPALLDEIRGLLAATRFVEHRHQTNAVDERAEPGVLSALLLLVLNDVKLLELIEGLTGRRPIEGFEGRVYRIRPSAGHEDSWHSDSEGGRRAAISINLNREIVATAPLQIRLRDSQSILFEFANEVPGDAVLFTVDDDHVHRVKPTAGVAERIACSGWFHQGVGMAAALRKESQSKSTRSKT